MKANKQFVVAAYDIRSTRNRTKISKLLEQYGIRINLSVFEIMVTKKQMEEIKLKVNNLMNQKTDTVAFYPVCINCFTKIDRMPNRTKTPVQVVAL